MIFVLRQLWDVCLFRRGPQDLPYSPVLASGLLVLQAAGGLLYLRVVEAGPDGLPLLALSLAFSVAAPWLLLRARGLQPRYVQTLTALVGTWIFCTAAYMPIAWFAKDLPPPVAGAVLTRAQAIVGWATMILMAWKLAINAQVWRQALEWPVGAGIALALGLFVLELGLLRLVLAS